MCYKLFEGILGKKKTTRKQENLASSLPPPTLSSFLFRNIFAGLFCNMLYQYINIYAVSFVKSSLRSLIKMEKKPTYISIL